MGGGEGRASGEDRLPPGREKGPGEPQERLGQKDQDARVRPEAGAGKVRQAQVRDRERGYRAAASGS